MNDEVKTEVVDVSPENPIVDFLKAVEDQNFSDAERQFNDLVGDRLQATLDQAKIRLASSFYNTDEVDEFDDETEEDFEDTDFDDDDL
jgi:hypothetical protein